ncbi:MAG: DUF551 domain-containing protein [Vibrio sp.]|uniref:DUF551 domain-containing protein n=1 Tax=Vibrio sp. TaxID=678 RepID=UPI001EC72A47|nr:DUF551 domain-containing protein [Vibrio sp.]NRB70140.1 DUF551 domain-containing protein [Vibrio sp.]
MKPNDIQIGKQVRIVADGPFKGQTGFISDASLSIKVELDDKSDFITHHYVLCSEIEPLRPTKPESPWVSVEDRLPDEDGRYLIAKPNGGIGYIWYYRHHGGTFFGGVVATHWMKVPQPPKGE